MQGIIGDHTAFQIVQADWEKHSRPKSRARPGNHRELGLGETTEVESENLRELRVIIPRV